MPKKKKGKDGTTTEFKFDYRYTPKPYFTAPNTSGSPSSPAAQASSPLTSRSSQQQKPKSSLNSDAWQAQKQRHYGYANSYARVATQPPSSSASVSVPRSSSIEVTSTMEGTAVDSTPTVSKKDKATKRKMFEEMFKGRVEGSVIDMVLQDANWNENEALDMLSQIAPEDNSHLYTTLNGPDTTAGFGAITPDHNLTPTAPTLSYCSSITSLDEFGVEYSRNLTQRNLSQVADVLRNPPDDTINDLDRQRLARSRATTPRSLLRSNTLTVKNISLGSTESLESNRSHFSQDLQGITYACEGTPKKSNVEQSMSLYDISDPDDIGLTLTAATDQAYDSESAKSDPGTIESLLIPLDHGDIVLEKGTYDSLLNGDDTATQPESTSSVNAGPLPHSASISDYSQAISSLTTQLATDELHNVSSATDLPAADSKDETAGPAGPSGATGHSMLNGDTKGDNLSMSYSDKLSSNKENQYPYDGLLGSGVAVPTAFESARPKHRKVPPKAAPTDMDETTSSLLELAVSGEKVMFILRGAPGSGKSTLARTLIDKNGGQVFTGDDFFVNDNGQYNWESHLLPEAHAWNQGRARKAAEAGITPIVIDNTNLQAWEMEPYVKICLQHAYRPVLAEPNTLWRYKAKELYKKNTHHVPYAKVKSMLERFELPVTAQQLIDRVTSKDQQLLPMAEQLKTKSAPTATKLSRRKQTSKTIKRNQQHDTIEKFKDKKVEELTFGPPRRQTGADEDENQGETEIMYPNTASLNALKRSNTIKVLNCDKPKASEAKPKASEAKPKASEAKPKASEAKPKASETKPKANEAKPKASETKPKASEAKPSTKSTEKVKPKSDETKIDNKLETKPNDVDKSTSKTRNKHSSKSAGAVPSGADLVRSERTSDLTSAPSDVTETDRKSAVPEVLPISVGNQVSSLDKSVSVDTGLGKSVKDKTTTNLHNLDQSELSNGGRNYTSGSSTLPRSSTSGDSSELILAHSTSLPRPKDKSKSKKSSSKKSTSTSILNADVEQMGRWLSNDWSAPPYPSVVTSSSTKSSPDIAVTSSVRSTTPSDSLTSTVSSTNTRVASTSAADLRVPSAYVVTSPMPAAIDPPPPYEEREGAAAAATAADDGLSYTVKKKDGWTLTEPSDYAMAYKAMQRNHQLPEGWVMLAGHCKEPSSLPLSVPHSAVPTHDKGTVVGEDDIPQSISASTEELSAIDKLNRLHTCFPQLSKEQLAEFLELCKGDETWATNLLLDSNKVSLAKRNKRSTSALSIAGLNKRMVHKYKCGKSSLVERFSRAMVPVASCLGKHGQPLHPQLTQDSISLNLTQQQATDLHEVFGRGTELPSALSNGEVMVDVPRWIAHKIYRCMTEGTSNGFSSSEHIILPTPVRPVRPPRRQRTRRTSPRAPRLPQTTSTQSNQARERVVNGAAAEWVVTDEVIPFSEDDWTVVDGIAPPPAYSQEDEDLARRLQTEDLMDVIKAQQPTPSQKLSLIADEQYARSLMVEQVNSQAKPDLSTTLKRQKLYEVHSDVDKGFLDEVFKSCGYNLDQALQFLSSHQNQGPAMSVTAAMTNGAKEPLTADVRGMSPARATAAAAAASNGVSSRESTPGKDSSSSTEQDEWFDVDDYVANANYHDYRAEANLHLRQRKECMEQAALANSKKRYGVSAHYAQQAAQHLQNYREANLAAATQIFKNSNLNRSRDEVDLHGLHADEAVNIVSEIIKLYQQEGKRKHVNIITGRGNRSKSGVSRIKQAVEAFLNKHKICYRMENPGMIRVTL